MITINQLQIQNYMKQLEEENRLLKARILKTMTDDNTEIMRLKHMLSMQDNVIKELKQKNCYLSLLLG